MADRSKAWLEQGPDSRLVYFTWISDSDVQDQGGAFALWLDCSVQEQHMAAAMVTQHNVERGIAVTDYIRPMPKRLSIEGIITNTPLSSKAAPFPFQVRPVKIDAHYSGQLNAQLKIAAQQAANVANAGGNAIALSAVIQSQQFIDIPQDTAQVQTWPDKFERVRASFRDLVNGIANGALFTIDTTLESYDDMVCTSLNVPRDQNNTDSIQFQIDFTEIRIVGTRTAKAVVRKAPEQKGPKAPAATTTEEQKGIEQSAIRNLIAGSPP